MAWLAGEHIVLRAWERDDVRALWESAQTVDDSGQRLRDWLEPPKSLAQLEQEFDANVSDPDPAVVRWGSGGRKTAGAASARTRCGRCCAGGSGT